MPKFTKGTPKPPNSGKRKGSHNRGTERARRLISEADDKAIVDQVVRDAKANNPAALAICFRYLRPPLSRTTSVWPIDFEPPKSAQEARDAIARITSMIAKAEIDGEHGARIIAGLEAFLSARAAELEAEVERHRAEEEGEA
jgi:hypothetical protein